MNKHTPGPWVAQAWLCHAKTSVLAIGKTQVAECSGCGATATEEEANARLIAAAPELLELLQRCVRYGGLYPELKEDAVAAIFKATWGDA